MTGIVIPTYNEADNIPTLFEGLAPVGAQIIIVDDGSTDGTAEVAAAAGAKVIQRGSKQGLASAYVRGMSEAIQLGLDPIIQMDADLSHQPSDVPRLIDGLDQADLVLGSRWVEGGGIENWEASRLWLSRFGSGYARTLHAVAVLCRLVTLPCATCAAAGGRAQRGTMSQKPTRM